MKQAGNLSDNDINTETRQAYINTKLFKIYQMLDGLNDPFYNRTTGTLTLVTDTPYPALKTIDVSGIYFKNFVAIRDNMGTAVASVKNRVFDLKTDPQLFFNHDKSLLDTQRVWWYQMGDTIFVSKGASANALGTTVGEYRGKPAIYDDSSIGTTIDLPPENIQILVDEVTASYMIDQGKALPPDMNGRMENYAKVYEAAAASHANAIEAQNK
jgi:hypothetical protein